jgi:hydrogenase maturation protease
MTIPVSNPNRSISVIGLGNVFLGDDGFGPLTVETFRCLYECDQNVEVLDLGTPGLDLAPYLYDRALVIIIDAVRADMKPGTLSVFREEDFAASHARLRITGHDPGLWDTLTHLRLADHGPDELIIIGALPELCGFAEALSEAMMSLAEEAAICIAQLLLARGTSCLRRGVALQANLWWLPTAGPGDAALTRAFADA